MAIDSVCQRSFTSYSLKSILSIISVTLYFLLYNLCYDLLRFLSYQIIEVTVTIFKSHYKRKVNVTPVKLRLLNWLMESVVKHRSSIYTILRNCAMISLCFVLSLVILTFRSDFT